jgi:beta-lactamase regulating signal transducer with metallopeptidase domain
MHPETVLAITSAFGGFLLQTSLAFALCWALSKIIASPTGRFWVWFSFLTGTGCYWLWLGASFLPHKVAIVLPASPSIAATTIGNWQIATSWVSPLSYLLAISAALYLIALAYFLFAFIKKRMHLQWVLRFAYEVPDEVADVFGPIAKSLGVGSVRLMVLSGIRSPGTFGWIKPIILLPQFCVQQDRNELEIIFRHELQHIRRRDFASICTASLSRALLFFHPAMWYAMRNLRLESELACDFATVGDSLARRAKYAECLVHFARLNVAGEPQPWNLDFAGASSIQLKTRIRCILKETKRIPGWLMGLRAGLGLLLIAGFLGIAPSLFIVLSYEQPRVVQRAKLASPVTRIEGQPREGSTRRNHSLRLRHSGQATQENQPNLPGIPASAPVETAAAPVPLRGSNAMLANDPTLKRRGRETDQKSNQTIIRLSGESPTYSGGSSAQSRTLDSILTTISNVSGRGHGDKDGH